MSQVSLSQKCTELFWTYWLFIFAWHSTFKHAKPIFSTQITINSNCAANISLHQLQAATAAQYLMKNVRDRDPMEWIVECWSLFLQVSTSTTAQFSNLIEACYYATLSNKCIALNKKAKIKSYAIFTHRISTKLIIFSN